MTTARWLLAQLNIGLPVAPVDSQALAGFVAQLEPINALADAAPGFVWRLETEDGDATAIRAFDDDRLLINMSVWESVEALGNFVFRSDHAEVMRQRRAWFVPMREAYTCLWWTQTIPTVQDAEARLSKLRADGPTPYAFTFRTTFPTPDGQPAASDDDWFCRA